jgi:hypothetical protein
MLSESRVTTDHEEIRRWVEARGGGPVAAKAGSGAERGIVRFRFPDQETEGEHEEISWEAFFEQFEAGGLAFLYQERAESGAISHFHKLIGRETARSRKAA